MKMKDRVTDNLQHVMETVFIFLYYGFITNPSGCALAGQDYLIAVVDVLDKDGLHSGFQVKELSSPLR